MLSEIELLRYQNFTFDLHPRAKQYIQATRTSAPSRMVGTHAKSNLVSWRISAKTRLSVSLESRSAETAFFILSEYDDNVLELWEQPEPIKIRRHDRNGRQRAYSYTPDFLLLTKTGPCLIEVKTESSVEELIKKIPLDWISKEDGEVAFTPAERVFNEIGLNYRVFVYSNHLRYRVANTELILQARSSDQPYSDICDKVESALRERCVWTLDELRRSLGLNDFTSLVRLIDKGEIAADLDESLISEPEGFLISKTTGLLKAGKTLLDAGKISASVNSDRLHVAKIPTTRDAEMALRRLSAINSGVASRSVRRWKLLVAEGHKKGLSPLQALLPKYYLSGNRTRKVPEIVDGFLVNYLKDCHADLAGISKYRSYVQYRVLAAEALPDFEPVSQKTFSIRLGSIPAESIAQRRGGKRAANAVADPTNPEYRVQRAQIPWERAAIDHYLADIYLVVYSSDGLVYVERPWVTAMIDLATSYVIAVTISFLSPSRKAVSKIIRECVRLHGKLPAELIVDRGSEFRSTFMASLMAHYDVVYTLRPASHPRFGAQVERLFGEFKSQWLAQRPGNLADYKEARGVDGSLSPRRRAVLFPAQAFHEMKEFCNWRNAKLVGGNIFSASDEFRRRQELYPFVGRKISYDSEFMMMTAVDTKDYKVDPARGIHVGDEWYYSPALSSIKGKRSDVQVRVDPENPHVVYACINNEWVVCFTTGVTTYGVKTGAQQLGEGLVKLEAAALRRKVRTIDDENLCRIIRSYSGDIGLPPSEIQEEMSGQYKDRYTEKDFIDLEGLLSEPLDELEVETWSDAYD